MAGPFFLIRCIFSVVKTSDDDERDLDMARSEYDDDVEGDGSIVYFILSFFFLTILYEFTMPHFPIAFEFQPIDSRGIFS